MDKGYLVGTAKGMYLNYNDELVSILGEPAIYESKEEALEIANDLGLMAFEIFPMIVTEKTDSNDGGIMNEKN